MKFEDNPLAIEIRQEMAQSYFGACRKMVRSIDALKVFDLTFVSRSMDKAQIKRRAELLEQSAELVHFVLIQREAMGFSGNETFFEDYEIPYEVKRQVGKPRGTSDLA